MSLKQIKNAKTLGALARALRDAARDLPSDVNKIKQDTAKYAARRLVYETPVDTSLALSNWQVGLSVSKPDVWAAYFKGEGGLTQSISASTAYGAALLQIARSKYKIALVIYNNVTYINKLNAGSSQQADAGYVQRIEADAENFADLRLRNYLNGN